MKEFLVEYVSEVKNLGIVVQNTLTWETQVINMSNAVYKSLYQLRRLAIDFLGVRETATGSILNFPHV